MPELPRHRRPLGATPGGGIVSPRDEIHRCTVCGSSSRRHPEQCDCGCGEFFWPALCCEGCGCGSFEEAHRARDEMRAEVAQGQLAPAEESRPIGPGGMEVES